MEEIKRKIGDVVKARIQGAYRTVSIRSICYPSQQSRLYYVCKDLFYSRLHYVVYEHNIIDDIGVKETEGKVSYQEIDWDFIKAMAKRMNKNKNKYGPDNWKKPMDLNLIRDATLRHLLAVLNPSSDDPESIQDHLAAIGCNAQILYYHDKNNKE